jgi:4,5-DOPA dioxygenase extradiol
MLKPPLPVIFIGHGSPINILSDNPFTRDMKELGLKLPVPKAILVISAHWLTYGTIVTGSSSPSQIYDFYGFPEELYEFRYRAPGSPEVAGMISEITTDHTIKIDDSRGIDHAGWAILKHIFPGHDIPVLELSLDMRKNPRYHFDLGKRLTELRNQEILIIGSGNIVHNLSNIDFDEDAEPFPWAIEYDQLIKESLIKNDFESLIIYEKYGPIAKKSMPFNDHYLPMLYVLGMTGENEKIKFIHESIQNGSISMRSFIVE